MTQRPFRNTPRAALLAVGSLLIASACFRPDERTILVSVPNMKDAACAELVQKALAGVEGVLSSTPQVDQKTIEVRYAPVKLAIKNIEYAIAGAGFDANDTPAVPAARAALPEGCR